MKIVVVAGARPNFVKVAPILDALSLQGHQGFLVHTGQHYDAGMSDAFFRDLGIREPDIHLGVGSGSHGSQTARIMEAFEPVLDRVAPDWVVVVGDVNSTLACALVTAQLRPSIGCRLAHVEAGLRSGDWSMPEELNRVLTDRLSDLLFLPSEDATSNLLAEGIDAQSMIFVGNVMIDSLLRMLPSARALDVPARLGLRHRPYAVVTLHRPSNVDEPKRLRIIVEALAELSRQVAVLFPAHPRTRQRLAAFALDAAMSDVRIIAPLGYLEMLSLQESASVVLTDSGGVQEETTVLGVPCVTIRETTERPVTVTEGTNRLVAWPPTKSGIVATARASMMMGRVEVGVRAPRGWDGLASERIVEELGRAPARAR